MGPALSAAGALVAALIEITIASRLQVAGAQLQILLVVAVVLAVSIGFEEAMAWAFVGGLVVDLLTGRLLGSTVFSLLLAVGAASAASRVLSRSRVLGPVVAAFVLSAVYTVSLFMVTRLVQGSAVTPEWRSVLATAFASAAIALVLALPIAVWQKRHQDRLRVVW